MVLQWNPVAGGYKVYRSLSPLYVTNQNYLITNISSAIITNYTNRSVAYYETYFYNVAYTTNVNGKDFVFLDGPAGDFAAVLLGVDDLKLNFTRIELVSVYTELIIQQIPNPDPPLNPIITGPLLGAYKFIVYVGDLPYTNDLPSLQNTVSLSLPYDDYNDNGVPEVYNSLLDVPGFLVNSIGVFLLSSSGDEWRYLGSDVNSAAKTISFDSRSLGVLGIFPIDRSKLPLAPGVFDDFSRSKLRVLPNYVDNEVDTVKISLGGLDTYSRDYKVKVYTSAGKLVKDLGDHPADKLKKGLEWDLKNERGAVISTGLYIVLVNDGKKRFTKKLYVNR